jgi:hypothetical protein
MQACLCPKVKNGLAIFGLGKELIRWYPLAKHQTVCGELFE